MTDFTQGIYYDVPFDVYAQEPGLNPSKLKNGRKSMKHMRHYSEHGSKGTAAMSKGVNIHTAILEPQRFFSEALVFPGPYTKSTKATKKWKEFAADCEGSGRVGLMPDEMEALQGISNSVHSDPIAHAMIDGMAHEVCMFWEDNIVGACKCRIDLLNEARAAIGDIKTTGDISPWCFANTQYRMGTHIQMAWAAWGLEVITGKKASSVGIIGIEQDAPHDVAVFDVSAACMERGLSEGKDIAMRYRIAQSTQCYQGIAGGERLILDLPRFAGGQQEDTHETWEVGE